MKEREQKVAYSVMDISSYTVKTYKGIGKLEDKDLVFKDGKRLEDVVNYCSPISYKENEYRGYYHEYVNAEVETKDGNYEEIETCREYKVWYKII